MSDLERIRVDTVAGRRAPALDPALQSVRGRWREVVGDAVARHAHPARLVSDGLAVTCSSAAWASELTLLAPAVRERLRAVLGLEVSLRFEIGELPETDEARARPVPAPPSATAEQEARSLTADVRSGPLRDSLARAIARTLRD